MELRSLSKIPAAFYPDEERISKARDESGGAVASQSPNFKAWLNLNLVWAAALVVASVVTRLITS
jgi:hypothetical protein